MSTDKPVFVVTKTFIGDGYFEFNTLDEAITWGKKTGFTFSVARRDQPDRPGVIVAAWSPIGGLSVYEDR